MALEFDTSALGFSALNAYFLAKASEAAYATDSDHLASAADVLGLAETAHPFDVELDDEFTDCHGFVAANDDMVVIAFRGTDNLERWLTDAAVVQRPWPGGLVHKGFADALDAAWGAVRTLLDEHMPGRDLWLTGHDLGGALAVLAAARLLHEGTEIEAVYTFGAPRVGNPGFYESYQSITYRLVHNNDIVPHVPAEVVPVRGYHYYSYKHVGTLKYFDRHGLLGEGTADWQTKKGLVREQLLRLGQVPTHWFQDHHLGSYVSAIENNL
jgi:triacylglycerol lipase